MDKVLVLLTSASKDNTSLIIQCFRVLGRMLIQVKNFKYHLEDKGDENCKEAEHLKIINEKVNYSDILSYIIEMDLFRNHFTVKFSPTEFFNLTNLLNILVEEIDKSKDTDKIISLIESLESGCDTK